MPPAGIGDRVTVTDGPFTGLEGTVVGSTEDTVRVALTIFGRTVEVDLEPWQLDHATFPRVAEWPAGTLLPRLLRSAAFHGTPRQLRLFAVACCRRIACHCTEDRCRALLGVANRLGFLNDYL